ncbi:hypothetical protein PsorP6_002701 [Peronosclerospora sorghi]|uniref:Uncharacterized protein n=1 Tax=Peronosclerospora sorghi TaxID=230839 RepID=A0ACC0WVM4_9STRA|nr:hypothetical protein PsorP6_002701 [Peronosclerospora sorghi]
MLGGSWNIVNLPVASPSLTYIFKIQRLFTCQLISVAAAKGVYRLGNLGLSTRVSDKHGLTKELLDSFFTARPLSLNSIMGNSGEPRHRSQVVKPLLDFSLKFIMTVLQMLLQPTDGPGREPMIKPLQIYVEVHPCLHHHLLSISHEFLMSGHVTNSYTQTPYQFLMDPWWNLAAENQAMDRTHRLGQFQADSSLHALSHVTICTWGYLAAIHAHNKLRIACDILAQSHATPCSHRRNAAAGGTMAPLWIVNLPHESTSQSSFGQLHSILSYRNVLLVVSSRLFNQVR